VSVLEAINANRSALFEGNYAKAVEEIKDADMWVPSLTHSICFRVDPSLWCTPGGRARRAAHAQRLRVVATSARLWFRV
jgi:hypothetical protein